MMLSPVVAIAIALHTTVGAIAVPEEEHPITWVFAECRAVDAASRELGVEDTNTPEHEEFWKWNNHFWNIAGTVFEDTYEVSAAGDGRKNAMGMVSKQIVLGELTKDNWNDRIKACAVSYEVMTKTLVKY